MTSKKLFEEEHFGDWDMGYPVLEEAIDVTIPMHSLYNAAYKIALRTLLQSQSEWHDEVVKSKDKKESPDELYVVDYMRVQFALALFTVDAEFCLEDEILEFMKEKFRYTEKAYNAYMRDMFFRCNTSCFNMVYKDDVDWFDDFDVDKEKSKPFLMYHDWLDEKKKGNKTNYDWYIKEDKYYD